MSKYLIGVFIVGISFTSMCQNAEKEPSNYASFIKRFTYDFNQANFSNMVSYSSASFLKSVPEKELGEFLGGLRNDFGKVKLTKFKYFDNKKSAVYHAQLEKTWFSFIIGLDNENKIQRLVVLDPNYNEVLPPVVNKTPLQLPFDSTWYVFWGGDTEEDNYHVTVRSQKNAYDFVMRNADNTAYKTTGKQNEDYYCFGRDVFSPCNGEVVSVIDSVRDNVPGDMNDAQLTGNTIVIRSESNEYVLMAHFKLNSIRVAKGDKVTSGQLIGKVGNSGNSSEPHLHFHLMDAPTLKQGTGIKCNFHKLKVNGTLKTNYSPVKGERIEKVN